MKKILIIRFSSFGDVVQAMNSSRALKLNFPEAKITWLTKKMFADFLQAESSVDEVITLEDFNSSIWKIKGYIIKEKFDFIYDAHRNLRTFILRISLLLHFQFSKWIYRPKSRFKRFLLFNFKINLLPRPFYARDSYLTPIECILGKKMEFDQANFTINFSRMAIENFPFTQKPYLLFAPSAAWEMKRWPIDYWRHLIDKISQKITVVLVGGSNDLFIKDLYQENNSNVIDLTGRTSFLETFFLVQHSIYTLSADTGVIHVAELLNKAGGHLLGPTAFGRTKNKNIKIFEADLSCRPCSKDGRGNCKRKIYQECMKLLKPDMVESDILKYI